MASKIRATPQGAYSCFIVVLVLRTALWLADAAVLRDQATDAIEVVSQI